MEVFREEPPTVQLLTTIKLPHGASLNSNRLLRFVSALFRTISLETFKFTCNILLSLASLMPAAQAADTVCGPEIKEEVAVGVDSVHLANELYGNNPSWQFSVIANANNWIGSFSRRS